MKLWHSYLKELKLSSKGFYFYMEIFMMVVILVLLLFVIPENMTTTSEEYLSLDMPKEIKSQYIEGIEDKDSDASGKQVVLKLDEKEVKADLYELEGKEIYLIDNKEDMISLTKNDRPVVGAFISWDTDKNEFKYDYYIQGYEGERLKNLYKIIHSMEPEKLKTNIEKVQIKALESGHEQQNTRQMALPALITFNGSLMGMFIMAAYIFLDKQEGIIKAYAVTASSVWQYLLSKALMLMTVTLITTLVIVIPVAGTQPKYLSLIILLLTSAFFSSSVGLLISSFYKNLTQAFAAIYSIMILFMLPAIAYFIPSWDPLWVKFIPIHYLIQGFKETMLVNGDNGYVMLVSLGFLLTGGLIFLLANYKFKRTLTV
ncbi:MAG: ABC transporter permease [Clostridiales bacterium]